jgi:NhaP-type Na+/H+ or K+/H+ antiporter
MSLRRIPVIFLLKPFNRRVFKTNIDAFFLGWFGPMGVSAIFYAMIILKELKFHFAWTLISLIVFSSVYLHGITAQPFTIHLGNKYFKKEPKEPIKDNQYDDPHFSIIIARLSKKLKHKCTGSNPTEEA